MSRRRKGLLALGVVLAAYPLLLIVLSYVLADRVEERVRNRLAFSLRADELRVDEVDVSLLRGRIQVHGIHAQRTGIGTASVDIGSLDIQVAAMGWALIDDALQRVDIDDAHLQLSAVGAATLRSSDSEPLQVGEFTITRSSATLVATGFLPSIGKAELKVERAHALDLQIKDAMSWLYQTDQLVASLQAPGDLDVGLQYGDQRMTVTGSVLGSDAITVPFVWPIPDPTELELEQIMSVAKALGKIVAKEYARRKAQDMWEDVAEAID